MRAAFLGLVLAAAPLACLGVTAEEVIALKKKLEPVYCEALQLERDMAAQIRESGMPVQELMKRDINEDTPVAKNIKRISERIQELMNANMPAIRRAGELEQQLAAEEWEKVSSYMQKVVKDCPSR